MRWRFSDVVSRRRLLEDSSLGKHATEEQKACLSIRTTLLHRRVKAWIAIQELYMPSVTVHRANQTANETGQVSIGKIPLYLPSDIPLSIPCDGRLLEMEWELRHAQCYDALDDIRDGLRLKSFLVLEKKRNSVGQASQTRSATLLLRAEERVKSSVACYHKARKALLSLSHRLTKPFPAERLAEIKPEHLTMLPVDHLPTLGQVAKRT